MEYSGPWQRAFLRQPPVTIRFSCYYERHEARILKRGASKKPIPTDMKPHLFNRRSFLKTSFMTAAACSLSPRSWARVRGANNDIRIAVIGLHGRGEAHLEGYPKIKGVRIVALCDVDQDVLEKH